MCRCLCRPLLAVVEGYCKGDVVSLIAPGLLDDPEQCVGAADVR